MNHVRLILFLIAAGFTLKSVRYWQETNHWQRDITGVTENVTQSVVGQLDKPYDRNQRLYYTHGMPQESAQSRLVGMSETVQNAASMLHDAKLMLVFTAILATLFTAGFVLSISSLSTKNGDHGAVAETKPA